MPVPTASVPSRLSRLAPPLPSARLGQMRAVTMWRMQKRAYRAPLNPEDRARPNLPRGGRCLASAEHGDRLVESVVRARDR